MRLAWLLWLSGCNQGALAPGEPDLSTGNFCSGQARVEMDGMRADSPSIMGQLEFLDCCEAAEFQVVSMQIKEAVVFAWRHEVGTQPNTPATLDLANLPKGWQATLYSGCSPTSPGCTPSDILTSGFTGTLTVGGGFQTGFQMSVCLNVVASTHPVLKAVRLWSPTINAL